MASKKKIAGNPLVKVGPTLDEKELRTVMEESVRLFETQTPLVLYDFSAVKTIRSSAAAVFVAMVDAASQKGSKVAIVKPSGTAKEIFDMLGVTKIVPMFPEIDEALEHFKNRADNPEITGKF
jgi:anti-anti-sigma factor